MLIADFSRHKEVTLDGLWMYDYGQKLQINGLDLPDAFEVHFSWQGLEETKVVVGYTENGISYVDIPNEALTQKRAIIVYIYLSTPEEGETTNTIMMYVNKRPAPESFEAPEDVDLFHYTLAAANEYLRQTKVAEVNAAEKAIESESWAHGHEKYPERDTDNAKFYAEAAKQVATATGFCHLEIGEDGHLYLSRTDNIEHSLNFCINENGKLEVEMG